VQDGGRFVVIKWRAGNDVQHGCGWRDLGRHKKKNTVDMRAQARSIMFFVSVKLMKWNYEGRMYK
jgi:hypothetical protein